MVPFERAMAVSYKALHCFSPFGRNLPSNVSDARINRGWVTLGQNSGRKGLTDVSHILTRSGRDMELSYAKETVSTSSAVREPARPRNGNISRNS